MYCLLFTLYWCTVYGVLWQQLFVSALLTRFLLLLMKLTCSQSLKRFPALYGTQILTSSLEVPATCLKASVGVRGTCLYFVTIPVFFGEQLLALRSNPKLRTTPCLLSATVYSTQSQLLSILQNIPPSVFTNENMANPTFKFIFQGFTKPADN